MTAFHEHQDRRHHEQSGQDDEPDVQAVEADEELDRPDGGGAERYQVEPERVGGLEGRGRRLDGGRLQGGGGLADRVRRRTERAGRLRCQVPFRGSEPLRGKVEADETGQRRQASVQARLSHRTAAARRAERRHDDRGRQRQDEQEDQDCRHLYLTRHADQRHRGTPSAPAPSPARRTAPGRSAPAGTARRSARGTWPSRSTRPSTMYESKMRTASG